MDQNKLSLNPFDLGVPSAMPKMIFDPIARSAQTAYGVSGQTMPLSYADINSK
jgi:hypothetical protein